MIVSVLKIVLDESADKALTEKMRKGPLGPSRVPQTFYLSHGRYWARTSDPRGRRVVRREEFYSFWLERFSQDEIQAMTRAIWI